MPDLSPETKKAIVHYILSPGSSHKGLYEDDFESTFGEGVEYSRELTDKVDEFVTDVHETLCQLIEEEKI